MCFAGRWAKFFNLGILIFMRFTVYLQTVRAAKQEEPPALKGVGKRGRRWIPSKLILIFELLHKNWMVRARQSVTPRTTVGSISPAAPATTA